MDEQIDVVVIGGGQAGLATSHELSRAGIEHVVLERGRIGQTWRDRWESFCLVTPNWSVRLPGHSYDGDDPDGYMPGLLQIDVEGYRSPKTLPSGRVLVVGSGQSGSQIAEELHEAGREVYLASGRAPWAPRRVGGRDIFWWVLETGFFDQPVSELPTPAARLVANILATGHGGGHDLHLRTLRRDGVTLLGHFLGADGRRACFARDLAESAAWGDEGNRELMALVRKLCADRGLPVPQVAEPDPFDDEAPDELDLTGFGAVVFCGGFRPDYARWVQIPGAFDDLGFPVQQDGASLAVDGLHFVGVHFLRTRKSALLCGVGEDAAIVARHISSGT